MKFQRIFSAICLLVCSFAAGLLFGQGTDLGIIRGTIADSQGAVVAGARVVITDVATGIAVDLVSDAAGSYEAVNLKSGAYKLTVSMQGFNNAEVLDVIVRTGAASRVDVKLTVKSVTEAVTITSEAPLIQLETPVISGTLTTQQILDLPRDSRDIYDFLYLNPNITHNPDDGFKFIGGASYGANFTLDGQRATGAGFGQAVGGQPSLETVGDVTVLSNTFSAEYGGFANIRVTTKRGTAQYHGSLFYDNRNSALAAWNATDKINQASFTPTSFQPTYPRPTFNRTEAGGSFGGPVPGLKKKTFFMFAREHRWSASPIYWSSSNKVPHESMLQGDFSMIQDRYKPAVPAGVTLTPAEIAAYTVGGQGAALIKIPQRLLSKYTTALVNQYFPHTALNTPINDRYGYVPNWATLTHGLTTRPLYTGRIDHDFSERDKVYGTVNYSTQGGTSTQTLNPFPSLGTRYFDRQNSTLGLSWNHMFTPRLINEARGGFNRQNGYQHAPQTVRSFFQSIGFGQAELDAFAASVGSKSLDFWGLPRINVGNFAPFGNTGTGSDRTQAQRMWSVGDTASWIRGKHSIRAGFDLVHNYVLDGYAIQRGNPRGAMTYGANLAGWATFLMGLPPNTINRNIAPRGPMEAVNWEHGYFLQDDFKITSRLTVNLGVRYEVITPFSEMNDLLVNFNFNYKNPTSGELGQFVIPSSKTIPFLDTRMVAYGTVTADKLGLPPSLVHTDTNNVAPRVGAAYRLTNSMVIRGGYGVFYPTSAAQGMRDSMARNPFNQSITFNNRATAPLGSWPTPFTGGAQSTLGRYPSINAIPFDLQQPKVQQFNITFEKELKFKTALRVSYLGTRISGLPAGVDQNFVSPSNNGLGTSTGDGVTPCDPINSGDCQISPADEARIPYPHLGDWLMKNGGNFGNMHANILQIEANRRLSNGFMFNASYALMSQKSSVIDADSSLGDPVYNPGSPTLDSGRDAFVSTHRFIAYGSYDLPVGKGRRYGAAMGRGLNALAGGWQVSFQTFIKSGTSFTPYWNCNNCGPIMPGNIFTTAIQSGGSGTFRPLVSGDPNVKSGNSIWNAKVYSPPPLGADLYTNPAVAQRASLIGPGVWNANMALSKTFRVHERMRLTLRGVFDNVFNHPTFAPIGSDGIASLGDFSLGVDPKTLRPVLADVNPNPQFGRLYGTYGHEAISSFRQVRLSLRLTF